MIRRKQNILGATPMNNHQSIFRREKGRFSLLELLVVVSIISILMSILLPALKKTRDTVKRTRCANNLKQIGYATRMYAGDYADYFVPSKSSDALRYNQLLESYGVSSSEFDNDRYDSAKVTHCSEAFKTIHRYEDYNLSYGPNMLIHYFSGLGSAVKAVSLRAPSNMISFTETACDSRVTGRSDASYDAYFYYGRRRHGGGCLYLFADSHVVFHLAPKAVLSPDTEFVWRSYDFSKPRFGPVR